MKTVIRVENLKAGAKGAVCFADIVIAIEQPDKPQVDLVTIHECSLRESEKGAFIGLPRRSWKGADGETRWVKEVSMPEHTYRAAIAAMQAAWQQFRPEEKRAAPESGNDPFAGQ